MPTPALQRICLDGQYQETQCGVEKTIGEKGWKPDLSDEETLEKLLALNLERAKQNAS